MTELVKSAKPVTGRAVAIALSKTLPTDEHRRLSLNL